MIKKFTLIEILIATVLMLIVFQVISTVFNQTTRATSGATARASVYSEMKNILSMMSRELEGAYPEIDLDTTKAGTQHLVRSEDKTKIYCATTTFESKLSANDKTIIIPLGIVGYSIGEQTNGLKKLERKTLNYGNINTDVGGITSNVDWTVLAEDLTDISFEWVDEGKLLCITLTKGDVTAKETKGDPLFKDITMKQYIYIPEVQ